MGASFAETNEMSAEETSAGQVPVRPKLTSANPPCGSSIPNDRITNNSHWGTRNQRRVWANYLLRSGVAGLSSEHGLAAGCFAFDRRRYCGSFSLGTVSSAQIQLGT